MLNYSFRWNQALNALPQLLDGALVTLQISVLSMAIGIACAIALTGFRRSGNRVLVGFALAWVEIARNTPALFQIYMAHFGLGNF
ncbi:MAG: ABC transporter permease subunit, partial [Pseudochelatococcus sp.]|uniref:ABC transporter permease subunit n=1 Tax=Pseudochelatococcus sp. TaxID=2020869 RepID=UPI003D8A8DE4